MSEIPPDEVFNTIIGPQVWQQRAEWMPELVTKACECCEDLIRTREKRHEVWLDWRESDNIMTVALCGPSRAGKDIAADFLQSSGICRGKSSSVAVTPLIAAALQQDMAEVYASRHRCRMFWFEFCNELRRNDPTILVRWTFDSVAQVTVGIRAAPELWAAKQRKLVDATFFVDNPRVPPDPTLEYTMDDCDFVIRNASTLSAYYAKLTEVIKLMRGHV